MPAMDEILLFYNNWPVLYYVYVFIIGLMIGSFLNVVIYRVPVMMERDFKRDYLEYFHPDSEELKVKPETFNLFVPRSRCPKCGHRITAMENVPVLSWLFLRGKCSGCGLPISFRYPAIETLCALLTLACAFVFPPSLRLLGAMTFCWFLISLSFIDFDKMILPDEMTLPLIWLGLIFNYTDTFCAFRDAFLGALAGYLVLWSFYWIFKLLTGKDGMGYGDFKLMSAVGAWCGWQMLPAAIFLSAIAGAVIGITYLMITHGGKSKPIPFGPYIAVAGLAVMWFGSGINNWYLSTLQG